MNMKTIAIALVAVLVIAGLGSFIALNSTDDDSGADVAAKALCRVNTDGSGIYLRADLDPDDFYEVVDGEIKFKKEAWGGTAWGDPGAGSIQHVQMKSIAESMGLKFEKLKSDTKRQSDTMYFQDKVNTYDAAMNAAGTSDMQIDGGILWEVQYSLIATSDKYQEFLRTNDLFPGHTCCVVVGNSKFIESNPDATTAFIAGYVKGVEYLIQAIEKKDTDPDDYNKVKEICMTYVPAIKNSPHALDMALSEIVYKYSDKLGTADLADLVSDIAAIEQEFEEVGNIRGDITDKGFKDSTEFAEQAVDSSYLKKAVDGGDFKLQKKTQVVVAAIGGDLHQIGLQIADDLGYFEDLNLDIKVNYKPFGGPVAESVITGNADIGFLGAPPFITNTVNNL